MAAGQGGAGTGARAGGRTGNRRSALSVGAGGRAIGGSAGVVHQGKHLPTSGRCEAGSPGNPLFVLSQEGEHGRLAGRRGAVAAISPVNAGLPGARSAITIRRDWSEKKDPLQAQKSHTRCFLSSLSAHQATRSAGAVRPHWSVENRNHYKRDASPWQEDRHRHRKPNAALNLALTPQSLTDFDWLVALDSTAYNRGGPPLQEWDASPKQ